MWNSLFSIPLGNARYSPGTSLENSFDKQKSALLLLMQPRALHPHLAKLQHVSAGRG